MARFVSFYALAIVFSVAPLLATGQVGETATAAAEPARVGIRLGLNQTELKGLALYQQKASSRTGYVAGAFVHWQAWSQVALQPEVNFSRQRTHIAKKDGATPLSQTVVHSYLNIPLLVKVSIGPIFHVLVGPQLGLLLSAEKKGEIGYNFTGSGSQTYIINGTADVKPDYRHNVAAVFGVGADLKRGLVVEARYHYGLRDINNSDYERHVREFYELDKGIYGRSVEVSLGYKFGDTQ